MSGDDGDPRKYRQQRHLRPPRRPGGGLALELLLRLAAMPIHMPRSARGFTLVELLVVLAIAALVLTLSIPALLDLVARQRLEGEARELTLLLRRARQEALTRGLPAVVERDGGDFQAFVDLHGPALTDPPDGLFNPVGGQPFRATDFEIGRQPLDDEVANEGPSSAPGTSGLTGVGGEAKAVFDPDGSIRDTGSFFFADVRGNYLEVRIEPRATGRVALYKYDPVDATWRANGEGGKSWEWK